MPPHVVFGGGVLFVVVEGDFCGFVVVEGVCCGFVTVAPPFAEFVFLVPVLNGKVIVTPNPDFHTCWVGGDVRLPCGMPGWNGDT